MLPRLSEPQRALLLAAAAVGVAALVLWAKMRFLGPFVAARGVASVAALVAFVALVELARRRLRVGPALALLWGAPVALVLFVCVVLTPMTYEMEAFTERLPRPEGGAASEAVSLRPFRANHPSARIAIEYPQETNLTELTHAAAEAFRREGWSVHALVAPGDLNAGNVADYGYFYAERWGFRASCSFGDAPVVSMRCTTTV